MLMTHTAQLHEYALSLVIYKHIHYAYKYTIQNSKEFLFLFLIDAEIK